MRPRRPPNSGLAHHWGPPVNRSRMRPALAMGLRYPATLQQRGGLVVLRPILQPSRRWQYLLVRLALSALRVPLPPLRSGSFTGYHTFRALGPNRTCSILQGRSGAVYEPVSVQERCRGDATS